MKNRDQGDDDKSGFDRRDFLKGFASAAAAAGLTGATTALAGNVPKSVAGGLPENLRAPPTISGNPSSEDYWDKVRKAFLLNKNYIHMNTGTTGSQPEFSINNLAVYNRYKSADPKDWQDNLNAEFPELFPLGGSLFGPSAIAARQQALADVYGADPSEIVLSYNTTDGCNLIFAGTPWKPGDRIVTTSFEHPALDGPIAWAKETHGVEVVTVDMGQFSPFISDFSVDDVLEVFEAALDEYSGDGKQYLAFSEIFYKNGLRLPVAELCALARSKGAYSIVDSAHGFGMVPIDLHEYGADFLAGAGHKWLSGGPGVGILYIRNSGEGDLPPFNLGNFFLYDFLGPDTIQARDYDPSIWVQFRGESNTPALFAMTDTLSYFEQIGIENIYERGVELGNYLKNLIEAKWPGSLWVEARAPYSPFATALTSFNPFVGKDDSASYGAHRTAISDIVDALAAENPKIYIRYVTWKSSTAAAYDDQIGFRVSTHGVYNGYDEIDYVFDRLCDLVVQSGLPTV